MVSYMKAKSSAHYQREYRQRLRDLGLVKKEVWILPEHAAKLLAYEKELRKAALSQTTSGEINTIGINKGVINMMDTAERWTTESLYTALASASLFCEGAATTDLIEGADTSIHIVMHEFGDLPLFLTVAGEQIIVEAVLWSVDDVIDSAKFNDVVLRTHKYFPLSTISLDSLSDGKDYYHMFGALSASSILSNVILEIETLASNVIQATEAYGEYISLNVEANA